MSTQKQPSEQINESSRGPQGHEERHKKDEGRVDNRSPNEPVRESEKGDRNRLDGGPGQRAAGSAPGQEGR